MGFDPNIMAVTGRNKPRRNYKKEAKFDAKPEEKKKRVNRNLARRRALRAGRVRKGDGKDVHHVDGNALNKNGRTKVVSASTNRSFKRNKKAGKVKMQKHLCVIQINPKHLTEVTSAHKTRRQLLQWNNELELLRKTAAANVLEDL